MTNHTLISHHSHFGIEQVIRKDNVTFVIAQNLHDVKRIAFALGYEVVKENHPIIHVGETEVNYDLSKVTGYTIVNQDNNQTLIQKYDPNNWALMVYNEEYDREFAPSFAPLVAS